MIQKIRRRFILIALLTLSVAMVLVTVIINAANLMIARTEMRQTLDYLVENDGNAQMGMGMGMRQRAGRQYRMRNALSESRYFTATISANGDISLRNTARAEDSTTEEMTGAANRAFTDNATTGFYDPYLYTIRRRSDGSRLAVFLNVETKMMSLRTLAITSLIACVGGILLALMLLCLISKRAIRPFIQSVIKQKQFITDAGHELKTPLTVISANMDVLSLDLGENEWVKSTQKQVSGMRELVNQLVYLSRMDEEGEKPQVSDFDVSAALKDAARPFISMAEFSGKSLEVSIPDGLHIVGDEAAIRRLCGILLDNAVKYSPNGDEIALRAHTIGKRLVIQTENGAQTSVTEEDLTHLFDRFYRTDASRSRESGGSGIGLAVARAIVEKHSGSVEARLQNGRLLISCYIMINATLT